LNVYGFVFSPTDSAEEAKKQMLHLAHETLWQVAVDQQD